MTIFLQNNLPSFTCDFFSNDFLNVTFFYFKKSSVQVAFPLRNSLFISFKVLNYIFIIIYFVINFFESTSVAISTEKLETRNYFC